MSQWNDFDMQIANQCAPVLLGIKMSNILITDIKNEKKIYQLFYSGDISIKCLSRTEDKIIVLVYRKEELQSYLNQKKIVYFLHQFGYERLELEEQLELLSYRFHTNRKNKMEFPHEIGIFLGYPLKDVTGFIENQGKNYILCGYWKVYHNAEQAKHIFTYFDYAKNHVRNLIQSGIKIEWILSFYASYSFYRNNRDKRELVAG